ncbi:MAG: GNAT family N-acetyltransferase [Desertimonas sp.]
MGRDCEIRDVRSVGADALVALFAAVVPEFSPVPSGPEVFVAEPTSFALGAYVDDEPAGLAWGVHMRTPAGRLTTYLHQLDVVERFRRRGLATALVREAMAVGRRAGATKFWLSTGAHNETAQALYASLGGDHKPRGDVNYWWDLTTPLDDR